jgi:transposase
MVSILPKTRPAYPEEIRLEAVQMLRAGRTPRELAESFGVSQQTLGTGVAKISAIAMSETTA